METIRRAVLVCVAAGFLIGLAGCDTESPIEDTGEEVVE